MRTFLPPSVMSGGVDFGDSTCWRIDGVGSAIDSACAAGLVTLGGDPQLRLPDDRVWEMSWWDFDSDPRFGGEAWPDYVLRSARECKGRFAMLLANVDLAEDLKSRMEGLRGETLDVISEHLWVALWFESEAN